jgi:hypothetical protein
MLNKRIDKLELQYSKCQIKYANEQRQSDLLRNALKNQSDKIEALRVANRNAHKLLDDWKNQSPVIKYKTITKIREVKSNECKDIKNTIDAIRKIDPDTL